MQTEDDRTHVELNTEGGGRESTIKSSDISLYPRQKRCNTSFCHSFMKQAFVFNIDAFGEIYKRGTRTRLISNSAIEATEALYVFLEFHQRNTELTHL